MTADVQRELAEALREKTPLTGWQSDLRRYGLTEGQAERLAAELVPLIADAEKRAAAAALREAGRGGHFTRDGQRWAADRAAALDPAGAAPQGDYRAEITGPSVIKTRAREDDIARREFS